MNPLVEHVERDDLPGLAQALRSHASADALLDEALVLAVRMNRVQHVSLLLRNGADGMQRMPETGWSLLHVAVESGTRDVVGALVEAGVELDTQDPSGMSCLHLAVDHVADSVEQAGVTPDTRMIELLLALGADPGLEDQSGASPADWAVDSGCREIVALFTGRSRQ